MTTTSWHLDQEKQQAFDQATRSFFEQMHELKRPQQPSADKPSKADRQQHHQAMKSAIEHYKRQLDDILTPAQLTALEVFAPPHGPAPQEPHGPGMKSMPMAPQGPQRPTNNEHT